MLQNYEKKQVKSIFADIKNIEMLENSGVRERIKAFSELGRYLREDLYNDNEWQVVLKTAVCKNPFFVAENIEKATSVWAELLEEDRLWQWWKDEIGMETRMKDSVIAIIMAGNIPWVGFHDVLSVLISGLNIKLKPSSKDVCLWKFLLGKFPKVIRDKVCITTEMKPPFDAVIATGSNNSFRYFDYYFRNYSHILRKNRTSCALITGKESEDRLLDLWEDIALYFGMGCRNVTKLYIPNDFDWERFLEIGKKSEWTKLLNCRAYFDNYQYRSVVNSMNMIDCKDSGFMLFTESDFVKSSVGECLYEYYDSLSNAVEKISIASGEDMGNLQCVVIDPDSGIEIQDSGVEINKQKWERMLVRPGLTQYPSLSDYADGVSIPAFLCKNFAI